MKPTHTLAVALAAGAVVATAAAGAWYTTLDTDGPTTTASHGSCVPAYDSDTDKAGYAHTVAVVTVTRTVEYREEDELPGGVLMSDLRVDEPLKGTPPAALTVGQGVGRTAQGGYTTADAGSYPVLTPGHRYVVGLIPSTSYEDGWLWFADAADTGLDSRRTRWRTAVAHEAAPHPDRRCDDVVPGH